MKVADGVAQLDIKKPGVEALVNEYYRLGTMIDELAPQYRDADGQARNLKRQIDDTETARTNLVKAIAALDGQVIGNGFDGATQRKRYEDMIARAAGMATSRQRMGEAE